MKVEPTKIPSWWPSWARTFARVYFGGTVSVLAFTGNVDDLVPIHAGDGPDATEFVSLSEWLSSQCFASRSLSLVFDRGRGIRVAPRLHSDLKQSNDRRREQQGLLQRVLDAIATVQGVAKLHPPSIRDPRQALDVLDLLLMHCIATNAVSPQNQGAGAANDSSLRTMSVVVHDADLVAPDTDTAQLASEVGAVVSKLRTWAADPGIRGADVTVVLICPALSGLHRAVRDSATVATVEVDLPDEQERLVFLRWLAREREGFLQWCTEPLERLAKLTAGLTRIAIQQLLDEARASGEPFTLDGLKTLKRRLIEKACGGLVEFIEPKLDLTYLIGHEAAKKQLLDDAELIRRGDLGCVPMGYLVCGRVGTGKTFLALCFAGSIGIPVLVMKNFREMWQGRTEANVEIILRVARALGPVMIVIDEADAMLGNRRSDGDSGTSARVFGMFASQMGNTAYRGKLLWMLLTCRPDLLPVDLKRQGRCEVHIPLFAPETNEERAAMLSAMARKNKIPLGENAIPPELPAQLTGADFESLLVQAWRRARLAGSAKLERPHADEAIRGFLRPSYGPQAALQELVAVRECTNREFLPEVYRTKLDDDAARAALDQEIESLAARFG
ncbi:MAG: ATP-binding protein [Planctomycetes bacterium]|nr:ATP-binding protein [Planctomycetota bacterium]